MPLEGKKSNCLTNEKYGQPLHTVTKQKIQGRGGSPSPVTLTARVDYLTDINTTA